MKEASPLSSSPTPLPAVVTTPFTPSNEDQLAVQEGDVVRREHSPPFTLSLFQVQIDSSDGRFAHVTRGSEAQGLVPIECLAYAQLKGENLAEQVE